MPDTPESLFGEWLERVERGTAEPVEEWLRAHPAQADELQRMHAAWRTAEDLLAGLTGLESALDELERPMPDRERAQALLEGLPVETARYRKQECLARTAQAEVWRVYDSTLRREVAWKTVKSALRLSPAAVQRFLREARLVAQLSHPNIVGVHDLGVDVQGAPWFTMPLVSGGTLEQWLQEHEAQPAALQHTHLPRAIAILAEVTEAIAYAHEHQVLHRDLKPQNIVVGTRGQVVVLDWGLAREWSNELDAAAATSNGALLGTPAYMAPEQAHGRQEQVDERTDVYALGAILYRMLGRRAPYEGGHRSSIVDQVRAGPPVRLGGSSGATGATPPPAELVSICQRAMQRTAADRYASAVDLLSDLRAWLEGRVVSAHEQGFAPHVAKWVRRNRAVSAVLASFVMLALLASVGAFVWRTRAAEEILSLSDTVLAQELRLQADELFWPPQVERLEEIEQWQERCRRLVARTTQHTALLADLEKLPARDEQQTFRHELLTRLVADLKALEDPEGRSSLAAAVRAQHTVAELLSLRMQALPLWEAALARLATAPRYQGRVVTWSASTQSRLWPLGPDPVSGLEEFALLGSGELPTRNDLGRLVGSDDAAAVLVLIPAGVSHFGTLYGRGPGADPDAGVEEWPRREAHVTSYLVAKCELTQAQWVALYGTEPAQHVGSARLPVESLSWHDLTTLLPRAGLRLPTELEWEHAARGRTQTRWWTGAEPSTLMGAANLRGSGVEVPLPVATLRANAFGLHDVLGNLAEWAQPLPMAGTPGRPVVRGGHYGSNAIQARMTARVPVDPRFADRQTGVRPVMDL